MIDMKELGRRGKEASRIIGKTGAAEKNRCLEAIAAALWAERAAILDANAQDVAAGRENGLNEGFVDRLTENCPGIRLVAQAVCDEDDVSTYTAVKKILLENPELDLLVVNVASAFGSMRAVKEHPKPLHVISTNRVSEMEKYLEEHTVDAMVTHQPWVLTDLSLDILFQYLVWGKKPKEEVLFTNNEIVIPENMRFRPLPL